MVSVEYIKASNLFVFFTVHFVLYESTAPLLLFIDQRSSSENVITGSNYKCVVQIVIVGTGIKNDLHISQRYISIMNEERANRIWHGSRK
mmetsp:Transcript_23550/g.48885  ORF Transcript_23550/g.48885 Transcript_23550/m.48885 type:complete len:90 (+) Transcript_23550:717-986(+)